MRRKNLFLSLKHYLKRQSGFTLVELLISVALMGIISVPIGAALVLGLNVFNTEVAVDEAFNDQQSAFIEVKEFLRVNPYDVVIAESGGVTELRVGPTANRRVYFLEDGRLVRRMNSVETALCENISAFELSDITRDASNLVTGFTMTLIATEQNRDNTLTSSIALRRY